MGRLIDKMLSAEFERYATADLNRPLDGDQGVLEGVSNIQLLLSHFMIVTSLHDLQVIVLITATFLDAG